MSGRPEPGTGAHALKTSQETGPTMLSVVYPWIKALHVISVIAWMAGLLYLPRLFVNHVESAPPGSELSDVFKGMERRLLKRIMNPAMIASWVFGVLLFATPGIASIHAGWMVVKLVMVLGLTGYHMWLARCVREFASDSNHLSSRRFRVMNEVPAVLMVVIVIMVIVRPF